MLKFPGAYPGQTVSLTFDRKRFEFPDSVLVLAFLDGQLLFTRNRTRGWELPGGKLEAGEFPVAAAVREVYEETGAELDALDAIAQYRADAAGERPLIKTVFLARVLRLHPRPEGFETEDVRLFESAPDPAAVRTDPAFSPLLRDDVYPHLLRAAVNHPFSQKENL